MYSPLIHGYSIIIRYLMLQWLFGSKKQEKKEVKNESKEDELGKDEKWVYDYVRQYLTSPIWRNPLLDFIEQNCIIFEDAEENKFEYTKIFQEFTGLSALLLETMIEEIGISEKTLEKCIIKGMKSERDNKVFRQILLCDNFLAFKKILVAKNKELEVEAMKEIRHEVYKGDSVKQEKEEEIDAKELERLEIEKAIAMSLAVEEKAFSQEEKELEEALKLSQLEYQKEEEKRIEETKQKPAEKKPSPLGALPPLVLGTSKANRPIGQFKEEESRLKEEIEDLKKKEEERREKQKADLENTEERKKRLLEQRELIRKKKQDERKEELTTFVSSKQPGSEQKISEQQLQRRRNLMKRLKEQLKE